MTIAEKSTDVGYSLEQIALDNNPIYMCENNNIFKCYCAGGEAKNINIFNDEGEQISPAYYRYNTMGSEFDENTSLATLEADFISYIGGQEYIPNPIPDVLTLKE